MGRKRIYESGLYNQYEELIKKTEKQEKLIKENNKLISELNKTIKSLNDLVSTLQKTIEKKDQEILRLKSKNDRDSSNSSKPSSTNGYKKVIVNRREKSDKEKGGQKGVNVNIKMYKNGKITMYKKRNIICT